MDVCLALLPYQPMGQPSLALGQLLAAARGAGLSAAGEFTTFRFAERIGPSMYSKISSQGMNQMGEWTFAGAAFPDFAPDHDAFLKLIHEPTVSTPSFFRLGVTGEMLWEVRRAAGDFIREEAQAIVDKRPRIVGVSSQFQQHCACLALLREVKALDPSIVTLIGGACCGGSQGRVTQRAFAWVDYAVSGEADSIFAPLCRLVLTHGPAVPLEDLPLGVIGPRGYRTAGPESDELPIRVETDMDRVPIPDFSDFFAQFERTAFKDMILPTLPFESGRGCWWRERTGGCAFCAINREQTPFRPKSADRLYREFETQTARYGAHAFEAGDLITDTGYFDSLFPRLAAETPPRFHLSFEIKGNLSGSQVRLLAQAGVRFLQPGIESLHDKALRLMNKGITALRAISLLKQTLVQGMRTSWNLLYGFPGEKDEWYAEMAEWIPLLCHLHPPNAVAHIRYDRYSEYFRDPAAFGLDLIPLRSYGYVFPLPPEALYDLAYFYEDRNKIAQGRVTGEGVKALTEEVDAWQAAFRPEDPECSAPALWMEETDAGITVRDTRPCAPAPTRALAGLDAAVLRAAATPVNHEALAQRLAQAGVASTPPAIEASLARLMAFRLVIQGGSRFLALPVESPRRALPTIEQILVEATQGSHGKDAPAP